MELQWFHNEDELNESKPLGVIPLNQIYSVIPAKKNNKDQFDFYIGVGSWQKKHEIKETWEFVFGAKSDDERELWITHIEFLRAWAVH